jgi:hypothetical protein
MAFPILAPSNGLAAGPSSSAFVTQSNNLPTARNVGRSLEMLAEALEQLVDQRPARNGR